jgi:hypothetical protein
MKQITMAAVAMLAAALARSAACWSATRRRCRQGAMLIAIERPSGSAGTAV